MPQGQEYGRNGYDDQDVSDEDIDYTGGHGRESIKDFEEFEAEGGRGFDMQVCPPKRLGVHKFATGS